MVRYSPQHKEVTRARIVETAREQFREHGFDQVSIDALMGAAGLTRGGFYAHFESKEALISEVLRIEPGLLVSLRAAASAGDRDEALAAVERYLQPPEIDELHQCPLVAHPADVWRGAQERRPPFAAHVAGLVTALDRLLGDRNEALRMTATIVGAAVLAASLGEDELGSEVLAASTTAAADALS